MRPKRPLALAVLTLFTLAPAILALDDEITREGLRGIPAIFVLIESLKPDAESDGLSRAQLQTDVELKLRLAGIKVLTEAQSSPQPGTPHLYLILNTLKSKRQSGLYAKSDLESYEIVKKSAMPSYKGMLTDSEVDDIVAYLVSLRRGGTA